MAEAQKNFKNSLQTLPPKAYFSVPRSHHLFHRRLLPEATNSNQLTHTMKLETNKLQKIRPRSRSREHPPRTRPHLPHRSIGRSAPSPTPAATPSTSVGPLAQLQRKSKRSPTNTRKALSTEWSTSTNTMAIAHGRAPTEAANTSFISAIAPPPSKPSKRPSPLNTTLKAPTTFKHPPGAS